MPSPSSICLFGGTFDPIHNGHLHIATLAKQALELDKVIFIPCHQSPHKLNSKAASAQHRLKMCALATAQLPWAEVNDYEITTPSPSYSWKTAEHFKSLFPESTLYWLLGTDQWNALHQWSRFDYLAEMVEFIICTRGEIRLAQRPFVSHPIESDHQASSTAIRDNLNAPDTQKWTPKAVLQYIHSFNLY